MKKEVNAQYEGVNPSVTVAFEFCNLDAAAAKGILENLKFYKEFSWTTIYEASPFVPMASVKRSALGFHAQGKTAMVTIQYEADLVVARAYALAARDAIEQDAEAIISTLEKVFIAFDK
jgi:hypothetical protein